MLLLVLLLLQTMPQLIGEALCRLSSPWAPEGRRHLATSNMMSIDSPAEAVQQAAVAGTIVLIPVVRVE